MATALAASAPVGSIPLRNPRHEAYAKARALNQPPAVAAKEAGLKRENGAVTKLERNRRILARMAWFARQDDELLRAKRAKLEGFLWAVHEVNYADFWDGKRLRDFDELPEHLQMLIESLKFTEKGKPILSVYSKMQANIELRKLNMIGASVERGEASEDYGRLTDKELVEAIANQARELGRYDQLFASIGGEAP